MNITDFARLGAKARWKGVSQKDRSRIMREISLKRLDKNGKLKRKRRNKVVIPITSLLDKTKGARV